MITLIAAVSTNGVIGAAGRLPWHLPEDLRHYRAVTIGNTMIVGRKTFEAIGRALPDRRTIVVTRDPHWAADGATTAASIDDALREAGTADVFIAGGGEVYAQTIGLVDRLDITHVRQDVDGDAVFPSIDPGVWWRSSSDERDGFTFAIYERLPFENDTGRPNSTADRRVLTRNVGRSSWTTMALSGRAPRGRQRRAPRSRRPGRRGGRASAS